MTHPLDQLSPTSALVAGDVMTRHVLTLDARLPIVAAWEQMVARHVQHAVVLEQGLCLGVVTLPELWTAWSLELGARRTRTVLPLATPAPCISASTGLPQLCQVLLRSRYGAAMVLDEAGELLGLVTADDVLARIAADEAAPC